MSGCDECRRGLLRAGLAGAALLVPGCGATTVEFTPEGGPGDGGDDGDDASDGGDGGGGEAACQPTCAAGSKSITFLFADYPALKNVGGSALNNAPGYRDPSCSLDVVIVVQPTAGQYVAYSAACSHQCCTVHYSSAQKEFVCPCHGSTFSTDGKVTGGPAPTGLAKLQVCADACGVTVTYG